MTERAERAERAAIFDLDRTLLRGASGPVINEAFREIGLRNAALPGEGLLYKVYDRFGENPLGMALARAAAFAVKGWPVEQFQAAGRVACELLMENVAGYAAGLLAEHKKSGHVLVLATTTPYDLVKPLADRLGIDEVIATRYAWTDGVFTGRLDGGFVWGHGKLSAVRRWAESRRIDLSESFAYSDSCYDLPLLSAVGHPRAVNPDIPLHAAAVLRRWPILHLDVPPGVATLGGIEAFDLGRHVIRPELFPYARFDIEGVDLIPDDGPFILVSNHRSYFDVAALAVLIARKGRPVRFLAKKELFDAPVVGQVARALGGIPVERGGAAADSLVSAERVLDAGEGLAVLAQGTIPRGKAFFDPVLRGKTGAARLAARTGAPIVPVALWNTEAVWPRSARLPKLTTIFSPPVVRVRVGNLVSGLGLGPLDAATDTELIMSSISDLLPADSRHPRQPTEEELLRTYPRGKVGEERAVGVSPAPSSKEAKRPAVASKSPTSAKSA